MLTAGSFQNYPPKGRELAVANLPLLRKLPVGFVPFLLKDVLVFDWKFPIEQLELTNQFSYLDKHYEEEMRPFAALKLNEKLEAFDWVNQPAQFLEKLSAHLWATHQMDGFRSASESYVRKFNASLPAVPLPVPRLGIAVFGEGVSATQYKLFRKLRASGRYYSNVDPHQGLAAIQHTLKARADAYSGDYRHWYIDGANNSLPGITCVDYDSLTPVRSRLAAMMLKAYESTQFDPEQLRSSLAALTPETAGMGNSALDHFQLTLLTEGSGTQIYSTTFVQWAAREALRRAQPLTLFTRYAPRQREKSMNELLGGTDKKTATDAEGSLIDGDMGAYYTWINLQRLPGADSARFLVWFEGHNEALAIAPGIKAGTELTTPITMAGLLATFA